MAGVPGEPPVLGERRCPRCLRRFNKLRPSAGPARRDCTCGGRWLLRFEPASSHLAATLGERAVRVVVEPWVDGRRKRPEAEGQLRFTLSPPEPAPRRPRKVARGTTFSSRRG